MLRGTNKVSVSSAPVQNQGSLLTFFGPETFSRGTGKPVGISKVFSVADFEPPFILHVRSNQVSSARISLNGNLVLGPSNFSQEVTCFDLPIDPRANSAQGSANALPPGFKHAFLEAERDRAASILPPSGLAHLSIWMAGKPGGSLTIWIEGKPLGLRMVGPEGGRIEFPNGVVLEVPPNAVSQSTAIELKDLPLIEANAILNARVYSLQRKHLLGGFQAKPEGLVFNLPVKAIVPVAPLSTPGGVPIQAQFDLDQNKYWLLPTDLVYNPQVGTAEITIRHFSGMGVIEIERNEEPPIDPCVEGATIHIVSDELDSGSGGGDGECLLHQHTVTTTWTDCPEKPPLVTSYSEMSDACGNDVIVYFRGSFAIAGWRTFRGSACIGYSSYDCWVEGSIQGNSGSMLFLYTHSGEWPNADCSLYGFVYSWTQYETLEVLFPEVFWLSTGGGFSFEGVVGTSLTGIVTWNWGVPIMTTPVSWEIYKVEMPSTSAPALK